MPPDLRFLTLTFQASSPDPSRNYTKSNFDREILKIVPWLVFDDEDRSWSLSLGGWGSDTTMEDAGVTSTASFGVIVGGGGCLSIAAS
jgi:hypothetical protein